MRRALFALALVLAAGGFATTAGAAPTDDPQPPAPAAPAAAPTPTPHTTKPARLTPQQRAVRACAKVKGTQAKATCQRRVLAQAKATPRKATASKRKPPRPAPTPAAAPTN
ncbi:MAG: hypothetical protein AB7O88_12425 [Reyranellaceae bacterium]